MRRRGKTEKEREENIWRSKHIFYRGAEKQRRKRRKIFGDGKNIFFWNRRKWRKKGGGRGIFGEGKSITEKEKEGQNSGNRSVLARFPDPLASKRGSGNLARSVLDGQ